VCSPGASEISASVWPAPKSCGAGGDQVAALGGRDAAAGRAQCDGCGSPANRQTSPAGSFRPNGFGLYDTVGNAAEWVEDCWNDSYRNAPKDAGAWTSGDCHLRALRGGSFNSKPGDVRSAARFRYDSDVRYYANGFRIVQDLQ
jgi:formylglycine-generating enzyme required for sulfatase activity